MFKSETNNNNIARIIIQITNNISVEVTEVTRGLIAAIKTWVQLWVWYLE